MAKGVARRTGLLRLSVIAVGCAALSHISGYAFTGGLRGASSVRVPMRAESAAAPSPSPSVALVKVTEENTITNVGVLGGVVGLLVGGVWVGGALFAAGSYFARKDTDVAKALKGISAGSLEALNFASYVNDKYTVTDKIGSALTDAAETAKVENKETAAPVIGFLESAKKAVESVDKDIGIKDTLGSLLSSASDLASQAVDKAVELNGQYKITDQIKEKIDEAVKKA